MKKLSLLILTCMGLASSLSATTTKIQPPDAQKNVYEVNSIHSSQNHSHPHRRVNHPLHSSHPPKKLEKKNDNHDSEHQLGKAVENHNHKREVDFTLENSR